MSTYTKILNFVSGVPTTIDLTTNTLGVGALALEGSVSGAITLSANATTTPYSLFFPASQGGAGTVPQNDGSGNLTWVSSSASSITSLTGDVTGTGPGATATTVAKIQGTTISGTTGSGNVAFSASPTFTGTIAAASQTLSGTLVATGAISGSNLTSDGHAILDVALSTGNAPGGYPVLDGGGKVAYAQLPSALMTFKGAWDASTNTPTLADGVGTNGDVWRASVAGTQNLGSGAQTWAIGDFAIYNGTIWQHSPAADGVSSVNGSTGSVTVNAINQLTGDVTASVASQSQSKATTVAAIQGTTVSGTTGSGNVAFSASPTFTGTANFAAVSASGSITGSNLTGTNTGDQTITLTGDVTGSGTGSFAATIGAGKVTATKLGTVTDGITTDQSGAGSTIEVKAAGISATQLASGAFDQVTITGGTGTAAAVQQAPSQVRVLVAGQSFSANTSYAVRWGIVANGETAGRIYACDTTTTSFYLFYCIGMASSTGAVSAGQNISVTGLGFFTLGSSDTAFGSGTDGAPVFISTSGGFTTTAPSASTTAVTRIGMVKIRSATNTSCIIDVNPHFVGIN